MKTQTKGERLKPLHGMGHGQQLAQRRLYDAHLANAKIPNEPSDPSRQVTRRHTLKANKAMEAAAKKADEMNWRRKKA